MMCEMELLMHSQAPMVQVTSSLTLLGIWLGIHACIKIDSYYGKAPEGLVNKNDHTCDL